MADLDRILTSRTATAMKEAGATVALAMGRVLVVEKGRVRVCTAAATVAGGQAMATAAATRAAAMAMVEVKTLVLVVGKAEFVRALRWRRRGASRSRRWR